MRNLILMPIVIGMVMFYICLFKYEQFIQHVQK